MTVTHHEVRRVLVLLMLAALLTLSFFVLRPILLSVVSGLLLAYIFMPLYRRVFKVFKERNTSALVVCIILVLIIFIPLWFLIPSIIQQAFDIFNFTQSLDIRGFIARTFATVPAEFQEELGTVIINFIGRITSTTITGLTSFLVELPTLLLHLAVVVFVFFFTIRDHDRLGAFVTGISPLRKDKQNLMNKQFKDITYSIIYGYIIIGIIQGIATGIGLFIFGVPRAILLTIFAIFASILPIFGPWLVWGPAAVYLFFEGSTGITIGFILYNLLFVGLIDNVLRPYLVSRRTGISSAIVLIGMIGGLLVFGTLGIILGPLILSYLIVFLIAYRDKTLAELFNSE